jgi:hypothetical protein
VYKFCPAELALIQIVTMQFYSTVKANHRFHPH